MTDFEESKFCSKQNALKIIGCNSHSIYLRDKSYDLKCKDCKYNPMKGKVLIDKADLDNLENAVRQRYSHLYLIGLIKDIKNKSGDL